MAPTSALLMEHTHRPYFLWWTADGVEALRLLDDLRPDLIFLDLVLPEIDGFAIARLLARRRVPLVIVVTAFDDDQRLRDLNVVGVLPKPFSRSQLEAVLRQARARLDRERAEAQTAAPGHQ